MLGKIASVKRMAVHDGPGVRTTLFLKGCPLQCRWCHNPECIAMMPEIAYIEHKCVNCGDCTTLCVANTIVDHTHRFDRNQCIHCGKCALVCLGGAFTFYGKSVTSQEAADILLEDRAFYQTSGGGITLSGGEPLLQPDFTAEVLRLMKQEGIHTAVDTCGLASQKTLEKMIPYTDLFLYDIKAIDPDVHRSLTGQDNAQILQNLAFLMREKKQVEIRIPYIPGMNDQEIPAMGRFLRDLDFDLPIRVLPYHPYAASKYTAIGRTYTMPDIKRPAPQEMETAVSTLKAFGLNAFDGGNLS